MVQFSRSVASNSLRPHGLQHTRLPCPLPTPGACSNSCPLSWWCHPTISSSVSPFSSCLQSFPASGSLLMSQFFQSGGQSIGTSASASVLPMNIQDWFPLGLTDLISLQSRGLAQQPRCFQSSCSSFFNQFSRSVMFNSVTPWIVAHQASLSFTISQSLLKFMSIELVMPSNHLVLCCPL